MTIKGNTWSDGGQAFLNLSRKYIRISENMETYVSSIWLLDTLMKKIVNYLAQGVQESLGGLQYWSFKWEKEFSSISVWRSMKLC